MRKPKPKDKKGNSVNKGKGKITPQTPEVISEVVSLVDDLENTGAKKHTMEEIRKSLKNTTSPVKRVRHDEPNFGVNRSKMREPRPNIWKKNVLKAARNSGKEYSYQAKKTKQDKIKRARRVGEPCTCKRKCFDRVGRDNIQAMHESFWNIGDYDLEQNHLHKLLTSNDVKSDHSEQTVRFGYHVIVNYKPINICRKAFLSILDIDKSRVDNLRKKSILMEL